MTGHKRKLDSSRDRKKIHNGQEYLESLRGRNLDVFLLGEKIQEPVDHPILRPSANALAKTYDLGVSNPELATVKSPFTGERVSRFLHICMSAHELVLQTKCSDGLGNWRGHVSSAV